MEVCFGSAGADALDDTFASLDGCPGELDRKHSRARRQGSGPLGTFGVLCPNRGTAPGHLALGTPTTTCSSTELEPERPRGKDTAKAFLELVTDLPSSAEERCFTLGGPETPCRTFDGGSLTDESRTSLTSCATEEASLLGEQLGSFAELTCYLRDLPPKNEEQARALIAGAVEMKPPYGPVIINVWKVQLGESGRGDLKRDISERISAFPYLKTTVNAVSKLKAATVDQLVVISEIVGLLKKTLRIAQRYELERVPATRLSSVKRPHRARAAASACAVLPDAKDALYQTAMQRRGHRAEFSAQAAPPPAKLRKRGLTWSKTGASISQDACCPAGPAVLALQRLHSIPCSPSVARAPLLLANDLAPSFKRSGADCPRNSTRKNSGEGSPRHRGAQLVAEPAVCLQHTREESSVRPCQAAAQGDLRWHSDGAPGAQSPTTEGTDRSCCRLLLRAAGACPGVQSGDKRSPLSASFPFDNRAPVCEPRSTASLGFSPQELVHSLLTEVLDESATPSQLRNILDAVISAWRPPVCREAHTARTSCRCFSRGRKASKQHSHATPWESAVFAEDRLSASENTRNATACQSNLKLSSADHFFGNSRVSSLPWNPEAVQPTGALHRSSSDMTGDDAAETHFNAAADSAMATEETCYLNPKPAEWKDDGKRNNDAASCIVALMLQNQRLRMEIKDHQRQAETFARALVSLFKEVLIQMLTELTSTVAGHFQELLTEQTPCRSSQPADVTLTSPETHTKTTGPLFVQIPANPDCSSQPTGNTDPGPAAQTPGMVPVGANSVARANRDTV